MISNSDSITNNNDNDNDDDIIDDKRHNNNKDNDDDNNNVNIASARPSRASDKPTTRIFTSL